MTSEIIVGILSLCGTLIGSVTAIMVSNRLTIYRIDSLEEEVRKWNKVKERTYNLEKAENAMEIQLEEIKKNIEELKEYHR